MASWRQPISAVQTAGPAQLTLQEPLAVAFVSSQIGIEGLVQLDDAVQPAHSPAVQIGFAGSEHWEEDVQAEHAPAMQYGFFGLTQSCPLLHACGG